MKIYTVTRKNKQRPHNNYSREFLSLAEAEAEVLSNFDRNIIDCESASGPQWSDYGYHNEPDVDGYTVPGIYHYHGEGLVWATGTPCYFNAAECYYSIDEEEGTK